MNNRVASEPFLNVTIKIQMLSFCEYRLILKILKGLKSVWPWFTMVCMLIWCRLHGWRVEWSVITSLLRDVLYHMSWSWLVCVLSYMTCHGRHSRVCNVLHDTFDRHCMISLVLIGDCRNWNGSLNQIVTSILSLGNLNLFYRKLPQIV